MWLLVWYVLRFAPFLLHNPAFLLCLHHRSFFFICYFQVNVCVSSSLGVCRIVLPLIFNNSGANLSYFLLRPPAFLIRRLFTVLTCPCCNFHDDPEPVCLLTGEKQKREAQYSLVKHIMCLQVCCRKLAIVLDVGRYLWDKPRSNI